MSVHQIPKSAAFKAGYPLVIFEDRSIAESYLCGLCKNVCRDVMELTCDVHKDDDSLTYCIECLKAYLDTHNNQCPVSGHSNTTYHCSRFVRRLINGLRVICPSSVTQDPLNDDQKSMDLEYTPPNSMSVNRSTPTLVTAATTTATTTTTTASPLFLNDSMMEGRPLNQNRTDTIDDTLDTFNPSLSMSALRCEWRGYLKDLHTHLSDHCRFKEIRCEFFEYGCREMVFITDQETHRQNSAITHISLLRHSLKLSNNRTLNLEAQMQAHLHAATYSRAEVAKLRQWCTIKDAKIAQLEKMVITLAANLKGTKRRMDNMRQQLQVVLESKNDHYNEPRVTNSVDYLFSSCGLENKVFEAGRKFASDEDCAARSNVCMRPNTGTYAITYRVDSTGDRANIAAIVTESANLQSDLLEDRFYIGWRMGGISADFPKGIRCGFEETKEANIFYQQCIIVGEALPKITEGDRCTLIFDSNEKTLRFRHNDTLLNTVVRNMPCDVYFAAARFLGSFSVTIVSH